MDNSVSAPVNEVPSVNCCVICGKHHSIEACDYVQISLHVSDTPIPARARLTLPRFLEVQSLSDGSYSTSTKIAIQRGTRFGPFQAEKAQSLAPSIGFPLKIFSVDENDNCEEFLDNNNEEKCSWLMYVGPAEFVEEQNLICYQDKGDIYYVALKYISPGEVLKVWYSPYYAFKMNKQALPPKPGIEDGLKNLDVNSLIKKQQKIMERKVWTCKFCSHMENNIVSFARHILKHYSAQHKNICEMCKKTFGSKKHLKNHMKIIHKMFFSASPPKATKNIDVGLNAQCKDVALGGPLLNDIFTDSSDLQQSDLNQFDLNIDNQNLLLDNDNLTVDHLLNENVKDLDHFNFEIDDNQKQFVCDICLKQFTKVKLLIVHLRHHTGDFMCYKCLKIFCRKENLKNHICNINSRKRCPLCDKSFAQQKYLSRHLEAFHNKKFRCLSCKKYYYSNKELQEHNCTNIPASDKEKFTCPFCDKQFYRDLYLKKHLKVHGPKTPKDTKPIEATCDICGLVLENRNSYYLHRKNHLEPKHGCDVCGKKFHRVDTLKEHCLTHQEFQFECDTCEKKFKSKKILSQHVRTHDTSNSFCVKCGICDLSFKSRTSFNKHVKNYHKDKNDKSVVVEYYSCPICSKSIKLKSSILRHLKKLHDVTNFDLKSITPKVVVNTPLEKSKSSEKDPDTDLNTELDDFNTLLDSAENNSAIQKHAVDSLVKELDIDRKKMKEPREVCLSIPDLTEHYQEITLDKNAYILDNGTIVQPQEDPDKVVIYVLDQTYS